MLQSETQILHKTKTTKSEPKQSLIRADLKPGLACFHPLLTSILFFESLMYHGSPIAPAGDFNELFV